MEDSVMMKTKKGFTLTEILIVVVIIGVLASLVIPRFTNQSERGVVAEAVQMLSAIRQGEVSYALENSGSYLDMDTTVAGDDAKWAQIGIDKPPTTNFNYTVVSGNATATRNGGDFDTTTVILNINGTWTGSTHPFHP